MPFSTLPGTSGPIICKSYCVLRSVLHMQNYIRFSSCIQGLGCKSIKIKLIINLDSALARMPRLIHHSSTHLGVQQREKGQQSCNDDSPKGYKYGPPAAVMELHGIHKQTFPTGIPSSCIVSKSARMHLLSALLPNCSH